MASIALTAQAPFKAAGQLFAFVEAAFASINARYIARRDQRILSQLSDSQLDDIGLTRADF